MHDGYISNVNNTEHFWDYFVNRSNKTELTKPSLLKVESQHLDSMIRTTAMYNILYFKNPNVIHPYCASNK